MAQDEDWYPFSLQPRHKMEHYRRSSMAEQILMPLPDYLQNARAKTLRPIALKAIEAYYKCDDDFDAFIPYLAMSYFDRVISRQNIKRVHANKKRNDDLFVICCLTVAWKTRKRRFGLPYFLLKLQEDYTETDSDNMEFFIKEILRGGVRSLTPFNFAEYFISIFNLTGDQLTSTRKLVHQIIVTSQADMRIATFRPSLVAASAVYVASEKLLPEQYSSMLQEVLLTWDNITKQDLSTCKQILHPIYDAKVESSKSSSAKKDAKAETSSLGLEGTGQLAGATSSSQPKPALQGDPGVRGASQVARASSSSLQEPSMPGTTIDKNGKSIRIDSGAPGSGELSTRRQSISKTVPEATIPHGGTATEEESKRPMGEIQQDLTAGDKAKDERPMEEIQQDPIASQALAPASAGTDDLKLDFELGWSKYDELVREMTLANCIARCCWII